MEKVFSRVRSAKDITITASLIIAGSVLIALPTSASVNILGFFMICAGLILAFVLRTGYKDQETGHKYCKIEKYFGHNLKNAVVSSLENAFKNIDANTEDQGNGIRLDIYYSKESGKVYSQLFEYIPYDYEPCTRQYEHELSEVSYLFTK